MKKLLTIAGSDSSGGAGIQADLKTFAAHKTYGMSVITSITAQNTMGVTGVMDLPPAIVEKQLDSIFTDIKPDAVKVGMISNEKIIERVARKLREYDAQNIVVDPVMVATNGSVLMEPTAIDTLMQQLLSIAKIITPNLSEAAVLSGMEVDDKESMKIAAKRIRESIGGAILITGGHLKECADDLLYIDDKSYWIEGKKLSNPNTHGTGCTLSSAIAVNLASGKDIFNAIKEAKRYITGAIKADLDLGEGRGPLDHLYTI